MERIKQMAFFLAAVPSLFASGDSLAGKDTVGTVGAQNAANGEWIWFWIVITVVFIMITVLWTSGRKMDGKRKSGKTTPDIPTRINGSDRTE